MGGKTHFFVVPATLLLLLPVAAPSAPGDSDIEAPRGIVDCLLPGPLRRIGGNFYQMPQRPARITASECTIRGGDFLLYDRANYETSLKYWISQAESGSGDADAMLYVGEIYEQGIGRDPDYAAAASWYRKAADAENTTAMISLAHLYKSGKGVPLDLVMAQALYSEAFGSGISIPLDPTSVKGADQRVETLIAEVDDIRRQKIAVELELQAASEQLTNARETLDDALSGSGENSKLITELRAAIAKQQSEIAGHKSNLGAMRAENAELQTLRQQLEEQKVETANLRSLLAMAETKVEHHQSRLERQQEARDSKQSEFDTQLTSATVDAAALQAISRELEQYREDIKALEASLRKAEEKRSLYQALASDSVTQEERVATLTARITLLEHQSSNAENDFETMRSDLAAAQSHLDAQVAVATEAARLSESEIAARNLEIERLRAAVTRAETESNRHRSDIDHLSRQSVELEQLRANLEREQAQSNRLQQLLTESQDRFAESNARMAQIEASRDALEEEIAVLRESAATGDQASQALLQQRESELRSSRDEIEALQARIAASEDEFARYQQQMSDTATRQSQAIGDLRVAVAASRAEREQLEEQLASTGRQLSSARMDLKVEQLRHTKLQDELRQTRAQNTATKDALSAKQREIDSQKRQVAFVQQELNRLNEEAKRNLERISELEAVAQAQKVEFVGPKIILSEPSEELLASSIRQTRGGGETRGIAVVAAAGVRETRSIRGYVNAPAGLASLTVNGIPVSWVSENTNAFALTFELREELEKIQIVARDSSGKEAVKEFEYRLDSSTAKAAEVYNKEDRLRNSILGDLRYYALLIGNEEYDFIPDLKTPVYDVKAIGKVLDEQYGFEVEILINATYDEMGDAIERLVYLEQIDEDPDNDKDAILIYYAGHGLADRVIGDNVQYFWMPVDAIQKSPRSWYETVEVSKYLKASSIPQIMVVADSCYAGNMPSRDGIHDISVPPHSPDYRDHVLKRVRMKSRFIFTSGGNEPVVDDGGDGHSVFASIFLDVLRENTIMLDSSELEKRVTPRVERVSKVIGQEQTPYFGNLGSAGHAFGKFFFPAPFLNPSTAVAQSGGQ